MLFHVDNKCNQSLDVGTERITVKNNYWKNVATPLTTIIVELFSL